MERIQENKELDLEQVITDMALSSGKIKKKETHDLRFGIVESYSGEGIVEYNGNRYKVIGHPATLGGPIKRGWVQVYKMREWQE